MFGKLATGIVASLAVAGAVGFAGTRTAQASGVRVAFNFPIVVNTPAPTPVYTQEPLSYQTSQPVYTASAPVGTPVYAPSEPQTAYNVYGDPCATPTPVATAPQPVYLPAPQPVYIQAPQPVYMLPAQRPVYVAPRVILPPHEYRRPLPDWHRADWRHDDHRDDHHDEHAGFSFGFGYRH